MKISNLIRWSGMAAIVGGGLLILSDVLNAALFPGEHSSSVMTTSSWFIVQLLVLAGLGLIMLGLVGLYVHQAERMGSLGLIAFVSAFIGTLMTFGLLWGEPFIGPMLAEQAPAVLDAEPSGALATGLILAVLLTALGWFLFGLAWMRAGALSRGAGLLLAAGSVLFLVLVLLELPFWSVIMGAAIAWMGVEVRSGAPERASLSEAAT